MAELVPWSDAYLRVRGLEGRLDTDSTVALLPKVPRTHLLWLEWRMRDDSATRLVADLARRRPPFNVLDVGCGNGWLANRIAGVPGARVTGIDLNEVELEQARRVFHRANLDFVLGDVSTVPPPPGRPDVIVLASMIQYVADLPALVARLLGWLAPDGELEILDSPFYRAAELPGAVERSRRHYAALGVAEMADAYHHHQWHELDGFHVTVAYRPDRADHRLERRLLGTPRSPFPWIRVRPGRAR